MKEAKLSIITITRNNIEGLKKTIDSVRSQSDNNFEFIVIDGNSSDGTESLLSDNSDIIDYYCSEPDLGIYDAMNKGIKKSNGKYLIMLNSGDILYSSTVIENFYNEIKTNSFSCYYSDAIYSGKRAIIIESNLDRMHITHQALIYKKELHDKYGFYLVNKGTTISDYLFFNFIKNETWKKVDFIIANCDDGGTSTNCSHYYQKLGVDLIFNNMSRFKVAIMLIIFPFYRIFRNFTYTKPCDDVTECKSKNN